LKIWAELPRDVQERLFETAVVNPRIENRWLFTCMNVTRGLPTHLNPDKFRRRLSKNVCFACFPKENVRRVVFY
jgi:hypothetical protein